jgi:multiple sugar transport system substrate-binding protein
MIVKHPLSRRQFLVLAGGATTAALLTACAPAAAPGSAPAAEGGAAAAAEVTNLLAWFTDRSTINAMTENEAIPEFEASNSGITVEMQFVPESELQQKLLTAKAAGNSPDVSSIDETFLDTLTKQDVLRPIPSEVINVAEEMGQLTADLYNIAVGDKEAAYYGLPNGVFSSTLYYNATLLEELGYTPDDIPAKWDDFVIWAKEVTQWDGDTLTRAGMALFANEFSMFEDLRLQIAGPIDGNCFPNKESTAYADEVGVQAWQRIMDIYDVHQLDSKLEGIISRDRFGAGNAVTMFQWTWFNGFMETQYPDVQWGIKLPPTISGEPVYGRRGPDVGFTVTTQNENNLEEAFTFYRYLVSPAYLARYCRLRGIQPSLRSMWEDADFSADAGERWAAAAIKNRPENSVDFGFWPLELVNITNNITPSIRDEGMDITTVLTTAQEAGNAFLAANPQWSILSGADYEANPQWLTPAG